MGRRRRRCSTLRDMLVQNVHVKFDARNVPPRVVVEYHHPLPHPIPIDATVAPPPLARTVDVSNQIFPHHLYIILHRPPASRPI